MADRAWPVQTPMERTIGQVLARKVTLVPILRAGLGMAEGVLRLLPGCAAWGIWACIAMRRRWSRSLITGSCRRISPDGSAADRPDAGNRRQRIGGGDGVEGGGGEEHEIRLPGGGPGRDCRCCTSIIRRYRSTARPSIGSLMRRGIYCRDWGMRGIGYLGRRGGALFDQSPRLSRGLVGGINHKSIRR